MITLYVIKSIKKKFRYVGITNNLKERLLRHNGGYNKSTKTYGPFQLILMERYNNYEDARKREIFLKSGMGRKFLNQIR